LYLVNGTPGAGKTTLALQFLMEGARRGERVLYITLSETEAEVRQIADSHGWSLEGITLFELSRAEETLRLKDENTIYASEEVDLKETMRVLLDQVDAIGPRRVVFDSLSEIRLLAQTPMRYRRQLLALKQHFAGRPCTILLLDDQSGVSDELQVESLAHGVLLLEQKANQYGADRRRLRVSKLRGSDFRSGYHDFTVKRGGLSVYPRLIASEHRTEHETEPINSGLSALDAMVGGGIDRSTCTLLLGAAGVGKSALAAQFISATIERGESASCFLFEERISTWLKRGRLFGMPLNDYVAAGKLHVHQIDPAELAPDEFTHLVRTSVENDNARVVVIDSLAGYYAAMPEARFLGLQIHELISYLNERGVASIITLAQTGVLGSSVNSIIDISYLADTIFLLRFFESGGRLKKAISVLKKRSGKHEDTIRELVFGERGVCVREPLSQLHGVLLGTPLPLAGAET
jgi:circadian clock protein KaiC